MTMALMVLIWIWRREQEVKRSVFFVRIKINLILFDFPQAAGPNMVHFVRKLKSIHPDLMVSQPTYGYPQVSREICERRRHIII